MESLIKMKKRPRFIDAIEKFQLSGAYPVFFAILCAISGLGDKRVYLPIISFLVLSVVFSILFVGDSKVFITPIFMIYYSLGVDNPKAFVSSGGNVIAAFDRGGFWGICVLAAIVVPLFLIRFIKNGAFTLAFKRKSLSLHGIIALNIAILLGGIFSPYWTPKDIFFALSLVAGLDIFYLVLYFIIKRSNDTIFSYACRVLVLTALVICVQICVVILKNHLNGELLRQDIWTGRWILLRENLCLSWGVPTIICASSAVGIPAALYLAKNEKHPLPFFIAAVFMWLVSILVNTRSSMIVGGTILFLGMIINSLSGKNKRKNLIFLLSFIFISALSAILVYNKLSSTLGASELGEKISKFLRFDSINDRLKRFRVGTSDFFSAPFFGVGWNKGSLSPASRSNNFYSNMYHCLFIQMGASCGILGISALLLHIKDFFILAFRRARLDRLFLLAVPVMILTMSLVDNFFFYLNLQIFYVAFLCLAEEHLNTKK